MARRAKSTSAPRATIPARTKAPEATRTTIPADWRGSSWQIQPMLASIRPEDYEETAIDFEIYHTRAGTLSDDWKRLWRAWCYEIMFARGRTERAQTVKGLFE